MPCTTILVGKNATYDGSTFAARIEDSVEGIFRPKRFTVISEHETAETYRSVISHAEIRLPEKALRMTSMPNADLKEGIWGVCGVNSLNISMTATETITSNERVLAADPLVEYIPAQNGESEIPGGIGEEDMLDLVLPYIRSAREGVLRLGSLLEEYGTYEMNGIAFQDVDEIWWLDTIGGHHWVATRVPDDMYVVNPNQFGTDNFDLEDALGEQKDHMCSADMREFILVNHLDTGFECFNARKAFGSLRDADHTYNTPRAWFIERFFNPSETRLEEARGEFGPESDNIPWCRKPERKITVEDMKYILSSHYQGTEYDPYISYGDKSLAGKYRPIGINRNGFLALVQIRPYVKESHRTIEWIAFGSNPFNAFAPYYVNIENAPEYISNTTDKVTTENCYWANRIVGALADANYEDNIPHISAYQLKTQSKGRELILKYDRMLDECPEDEIISVCEKANTEISEMVKEETYKVLGEVLLETSLKMKNRYDRSDS